MARRIVPFVSALFWIAISIAIIVFWPEPGGLMYWVRVAVTGSLFVFGLSCLWDAFFASAAKLDRLMSDKE